MAVYDYNADASTAVTAFLAQFTVSANGNIRFSSGTDTFHTWWVHRALQKIAWDLTISGDDEINLSKPNPSTSEALGTIITLLDHTTAYSVSYNITDTEAEYFFGGSIEQGASGSVTRYSGLNTVGSVASATQLQIIQNNALLTSHWSTGKNQTTSQTLIRILIKTIDAGTITDGGRVIVKANEWGDTYAVWRTDLGLGESVAAINTASDPNNDTLQATVDAYIGISNTEGYQELDISDGSGLKPYLSQWTYGANNKKALYEWVKSLTARDTAATIYGIDGDLFTGGPTFTCDLDTPTGTVWVQNEVVTWDSAGTIPSSGIMMGVDDLTASGSTEMWIHILTGVNPVDGDTITGTSATNDVNASVTSLIPSPNHLGVFTGAWIGDYGVGFATAELTVADSVKPLDNSGPLSPPNNVPLSVTVNGTTNAHVILAIKDGATGGIDETQYTVATATNATSSFIISEAIASDTPPSGWILVKEGTTFEPIEYDSWSGSTFTTTSPLGQTYTAAKDVIIPFFYDNVPTDGGNASSSLIYTSDIDAVGWVRHGDAATPHKPVSIAGTIGSAGLSLAVQLESE